jgi:aspartate kinase
MAGVTDELIKLAREISPHPTERELDILLATGEHAAVALTAMAINALGGRAISDRLPAGILTDRNHTKARIANISPKQIHELLSDDYIVIVAGFRSDAGRRNDDAWPRRVRPDSDRAGRGVKCRCARSLPMSMGLHATPRRARCKKLDEIAYDELLEMAGAGSKVVQSRAVEFAKSLASNLRSVELQKEERNNREGRDRQHGGRGDSWNQPRSPPGKTHGAGVRDEPGIAGRIFSNIAAAHIIVDMIVQMPRSAEQPTFHSRFTRMNWRTPAKS